MITIKAMRLVFEIADGFWTKRVELLDGTMIYEETNLLLPEMRNKEYFDDWERQCRNLPWWNIVEVVRSI